MVPPGGNANSCYSTATLRETFLTSSLSLPLQMMPAQERIARYLKAPMENMKIILGSNGVRSSICFLVFLGSWFSAVHAARFSVAEGKARQSNWSEFSLQMVK